MKKTVILLILPFFLLLCAKKEKKIDKTTEEVLWELVDFKRAEILLTVRYGAPIIQIEANKKKIEVVVSTGATGTIIGLIPEIVKLLNVKYVGSPRIHESGDGKIYSARDFVVPEIKIDDITFHEMKCREEKRIEQMQYLKAEGIIGLKFLKEFNFLLDYKNEKMILFKKNYYPTNYNIANWNKIKYTEADLGILVKGKVDDIDKELNFIVDTGCAIPYKERFYSILFKSSSKFQAVFEVYKQSIELHDNFPYFTINNLILENVKLGSENFTADLGFTPDADGMLGASFFLKHKVFFDTDKRIMHVENN